MVSLWSDADSGIEVLRLDGVGDGASGPDRLTALMRVFKEVAAEEGWQPGDGLERWRRRSVYFALEASGIMAGGLQLTLPEPEGMLSCFDVWPEVAALQHGFSAPRRAHVSILALSPAFRGQGLLFWRLAVEMWRYCVGKGITTLYIEVTPRVLPLYQRLGWPLSIRGELRTHWGEDCYLCTLGIPEVAEAILRRAEHSFYYQQIVSQAFRVTLAPERTFTAAGSGIHAASI